MKIFKLLSILLPIVSAAATADEDAGAHDVVAHSWDYKTNGSDWPTLQIPDNTCAGSNQSPIDLKNNWKSKSARFDNFNKLYNDQTTDIEVVWNGHTSQTSVNKADQDLQTFQSNHAAETYGASNRFTGVQFHFHHKSEHTVEGKYHDLEMHTVHFPSTKGEVKNGFIASAMGLMFSVKDYTKTVSNEQTAIIDGFFESLQWTTIDAQPKVAEVPYGKLMMMADMNNRWTYVGSVTTPPCAQNVYWNVLRTVYPIKQKHLDQFMTQLKRSNLEVTGNNRVIQPFTVKHNPFIITGGPAVSNKVASTASTSTSRSGAQKIDLNINVSGGALASSSGTKTTSETNGYLETVTILLIVSILFLLIAVLVVVKNSFEKRPQYQGVDAQGTERQAEGGEQEMHAVYRE